MLSKALQTHYKNVYDQFDNIDYSDISSQFSNEEIMAIDNASYEYSYIEGFLNRHLGDNLSDVKRSLGQEKNSLFSKNKILLNNLSLDVWEKGDVLYVNPYVDIYLDNEFNKPFIREFNMDKYQKFVVRNKDTEKAKSYLEKGNDLQALKILKNYVDEENRDLYDEVVDYSMITNTKRDIRDLLKDPNWHDLTKEFITAYNLDEEMSSQDLSSIYNDKKKELFDNLDLNLEDEKSINDLEVI